MTQEKYVNVSCVKERLDLGKGFSCFCYRVRLAKYVEIQTRRRNKERTSVYIKTGMSI